MAEDFHQIFGRGSDKLLDGQEVDMALWLAIQELAERAQQVQAKDQALDELRAQNLELAQRLTELEAAVTGSTAR
jgi:hypothetical protein